MSVDSERVPEGSASHDDPLGQLGDLELLAVARWIKARFPEGPVLDISSPSGFLANALDRTGHDVTLVTRRRAIADALPNGLSPSVRVHQAEIEELPFPDGKFRVSVCSSSELYAHSADRSVPELARVTRPDGCLIVTLDSDGDPGLSRVSEVPELLLRHFAHVEPVRRTDFVISLLGSSDPSSVSPDLELSGRSNPAFVVASDQAPVVASEPAVAVHAADLHSWWNAWGETLRTLRQVEARAVAAEKMVADRPELVRQLFLSEQQLAEAFDRREVLEAQLEQMAGQTSKLGEELSETRQQLAAAHGQAASLLQAHVDIRSLNTEIARLHAANAEAHNAIQAILASSSWRLTKPLRLIKRLSSR